MSEFSFKILKKSFQSFARAGVIHTFHGDIETPAFVTVGTKATVKALTPEMVNSLGAQVVLANTYHLYLQPGSELVKKAGGLHKFMNWPGPMMTDSGGFQVFSLGAAYGEGGVSKFVKQTSKQTGFSPDAPNILKVGIPTVSCRDLQLTAKSNEDNNEGAIAKLAKIDEDGVNFKSVIDGSEHRFTPEKSMQIQHDLGADIIFAFDECTSPLADYEYQKEAMERTHRWALRSLEEHKRSGQAGKQALFGIVQGGRFQDLREESARVIGAMDFDGFGIGGSFNKEDMGTAVGWVNKILPEDKPRHLLGIGNPEDIKEAVKNGADTFDCVAPTRMARNGTLMTAGGSPSQSFGVSSNINILNAKYREDFSPIEEDCGCYTCQNYTKAYLAHLFRAKEMLGATLASVHNLYFLISLTKKIRESIFKEESI